jgi:hypothetical protein
VSAIAIILLVLVVLLVALMAGGLVASARRSRGEEAELRTKLREADRALAVAAAEDRGWDRATLEAAARTAFAARSPVDVRELMLVQVLDRPGVDDDEAVFRVVTDAGSEDIVLVRQGGAWRAAGG